MAASAPDVKIYSPGGIMCEVPPTLFYSELEVQEHKVTPSMPDSGFSTVPPEKTLTLLEAKQRARVISAYTGVVTDSHAGLIVRGVGTPEYDAFMDRDWERLKSDIYEERYGRDSFFVAWLAGWTSTMDTQHVINLWALEARYYEIPPEGVETAQQLSTRLANKRAYEDAIRDRQALWKVAYMQAFQEAAHQVSVTTGHEQNQWIRKRDLYNRLKDSPPQPQVNAPIMTSRAEVNSAKPVPMWGLTKAMRLAIYTERITPDVVASVLAPIRNVVDLRRLIEMTQISTADASTDAAPSPAGPPIVALLAHTADILDRYVLRMDASDRRWQEMSLGLGVAFDDNAWDLPSRWDPVFTHLGSMTRQ